jgi:phytoene dehydrogenase-like protein
LRERIDGYRRPGTSIKVNLCLRDLPTFSCLPERLGQHRATIHLLPEHDTRAKLREAFADCKEGRLPSHPSVEWHIHTALVDDVFTLTPPKIESHFGITGGHIHHVDNSFGFADRLPYRLPVAGLYACGAGCHPAGSVVGAAGHNAANAVLRDLAISS